MTATEGDRKLAAILAADVAGYSRLMGDDERATVASLKVARGVFKDRIKAHAGRLVDTAGDSILAEFKSVVEAVQCAVEVQDRLSTVNIPIPEHRKMHFRVGINLGDIIEEDDGTIYGDGVNVAARLEALAKPGGIMVSESAHMQVEGKLDIGLVDAGEFAVKNIAKPVRVYRMVKGDVKATGTVAAGNPAKNGRRRLAVIATTAMMGIALSGVAAWQLTRTPAPTERELASVERMAFPLPKEPSIAVLPFDNLSATDEYDYVADGLAENIITALSQARGMVVIARNSTFTYKGKATDVRQIAEDLGVRYVLEGSIQVADGQLRATAQLIDALSGSHMWSERYARTIADVFSVQDDIALNVVSSLQVELTEGPHALVWRGGTRSLDAWSLFQRGRERIVKFTAADLAEARRLFEQAVGIDPTFSLALAQIGNTHRLEVSFGYSNDPAVSLDSALSYAEQAVALDPESPDTHVVLAMVFRNRGNFERALEQAELALRFGPNHAYAIGIAAFVISPLGQPERAIGLIERAMRLSPNYLNWYPVVLAESQLLTGSYDIALSTLQTAKTDELPSWQARIKIASFAGLDRLEEAHRVLAEYVEIDPTYSIDSIREDLTVNLPFSPELLEKYLSLLRKGGVPEQPT
jgi:adenylate cyclase